jgi:hypothetical protein
MTLINGMFPTLAETFGASFQRNIEAQTVERLQADLAAMSNERAEAIEQAVAAHELVDIQREQIAEYQELVDAQRVHIRDMEPLANRAAELAQQLADEGKFCDYFRDEAVTIAAHLATIDDLLSHVGMADAPTIERVSSLIGLWLYAEARAQGLTQITISNISGTDGRCGACGDSGAANETPRGSSRH